MTPAAARVLDWFAWYGAALLGVPDPYFWNDEIESEGYHDVTAVGADLERPAGDRGRRDPAVRAQWSA
ncbi:hypothetical protein KUTG_03873 [Kutzneria sp. 744]|nr:hypothetical protein KUTG_03873 [Kutzneria sp. 744]